MFINDRIYDLGLTELTNNGERFVLLSDEATTYTEANATYILGDRDAPTISSPGAGTPDGRAVTVSAFSDGDITATGTASHWAIVDDTNSRLLVSHTLASSQGVTDENTFSITAITIRFPEAS
jgi:hypothetical protein